MSRPWLPGSRCGWNGRDQLRPHTRAGNAMMMRNYVVPHLGDRRLDELDRRLLEPYAHLRIRRSLTVVDGGVHLLPTTSARPRVLCIADSVVEAVARNREEHERKRASAPTHHASLLLALGVPMEVVSERLGHRTIQIPMDTYGHLLPGQDADAAARFERLLWAGPGDAEGAV